MNNLNTRCNYKIAGVIILLIILTISYYAWKVTNLEIIPNEKSNPVSEERFIPNTDITCHQNDEYFIISGRYGYLDIIVRKIKHRFAFIPCKIERNDGDFIGDDNFIDGPDFIIDSFGVTNVITLIDNFLFLDAGMSQIRALIIYNLETDTKIVSDFYIGISDIFKNTNNELTIIYDSNTDIKADENNCPKYHEYMDLFGSASVGEKISLNIITGEKEGLGLFCHSRQ